MTDRGAKNLILLSRSGSQNETAFAFQQALGNRGANGATPACDVTDVLSLELALAHCMQVMPPIKGFFQATAVHKV